MKHVKKKFVMSVKLDDELSSVVNNAPDSKHEVKEIMDNNLEGYYSIVFTDKNELYQTFKYEDGGKIYLIPEPNPVVIYFDSANHFFKQIEGKRKSVFENLTLFDHKVGAANGDFYWYFSLASSYAIFLFTALEAFINRIIPVAYEYRRPIGDKKIELFNKSQIQRNIDFIEKMKNVLPEATGKNFVSEFGHKFEQLKNLKYFRDEVVHTKSYEGLNIPNHYENLYVTSLSFDFENTLLYARDFINYYEDGLIEECPCGAEQ